MSGEAGGILLGGTVLIGAIPVVLAGAAAVGCVVGLAKIGSYAVKAAEKHHHETKLKVERCSSELSAVYERLDASIRRERELSSVYYSKIETEMESLSEEVRHTVKYAPDISAIRKEAEKARASAALAMGETRNHEMDRIRKETETVRKTALKELENTQNTMMELVDWKVSTESARAAQRTLAEDLLRDARASVELLQRLASRDSRDSSFASKVDAMTNAFQTAEKNLTAGMYQSVAASAKMIITRSAGLAIEHEEEVSDRDQMLIAVEARLEALREELNTMRFVHFEDELYGTVEEDLDDYTQGEYSKFENEVTEQLDKVHHADELGLSHISLSEMMASIENDLLTRKDEIISIGHKKIMQYYERLHALQVISEHMKENGYVIEWTALAGDDFTQKMVVNFREPITDNTISVALDEDVSTEELGRMAMEVMFYYAGDDRAVSEDEKHAVRANMENALHEAGLLGSLSCTGSVGKEAANKTLRSEEDVHALPVRQVF